MAVLILREHLLPWANSSESGGAFWSRPTLSIVEPQVLSCGRAPLSPCRRAPRAGSTGAGSAEDEPRESARGGGGGGAGGPGGRGRAAARRAVRRRAGRRRAGPAARRAAHAPGRAGRAAPAAAGAVGDRDARGDAAKCACTSTTCSRRTRRPRSWGVSARAPGARARGRASRAAAARARGLTPRVPSFRARARAPPACAVAAERRLVLISTTSCRKLDFGAFHAGVELDGVEYSFGRCERARASTGTPARAGLPLPQTVEMGETSVAPEINMLLCRMVPRDRCARARRRAPVPAKRSRDARARARPRSRRAAAGPDHAFTRNCCTLCDDLCVGLGVGQIPPWINNLANAIAPVANAGGCDEAGAAFRRHQTTRQSCG